MKVGELFNITKVALVNHMGLPMLCCAWLGIVDVLRNFCGEFLVSSSPRNLKVSLGI